MRNNAGRFLRPCVNPLLRPRKSVLYFDKTSERGITTVEQMITANIMLDIFSIVLSFIPVVYTLNNQRYRQRLNQYFLGVSISNIFMIMGDLADWTLREITTNAQRFILTLFSVIFYVASAFVLYFFARYMEEYLKLSGRTRKWYLRSVNGEQLRIVYQIETSDFFVPPLTLQPLVENAVQHGILHKKEGGTITIRTEETDECAVVTILDDGVGMERAKEIPSLGDHAHIGIPNVRSRLEEMVHGSLEIESSSQGTAVTIRIPW